MVVEPPDMCPHCGFSLVPDDPIETGLWRLTLTEVHHDGRHLFAVTPSEAATLYSVAKAKGRYISPQVIGERISDSENSASVTTVFMNSLRKKLGYFQPVQYEWRTGYYWAERKMFIVSRKLSHREYPRKRPFKIIRSGRFKLGDTFETRPALVVDKSLDRVAFVEMEADFWWGELKPHSRFGVWERIRWIEPAGTRELGRFVPRHKSKESFEEELVKALR